MRIEIEQKLDGMQRIYFMFCEEEPEPEDLWVREQLDKFSIPPKRVLEWERDGRVYHVMQYGQCVIGHSMFAIEKHKGVVDKIRTTCKEELGRAAMERENLNELIAQVAIDFHNQARFAVDLNGELTIDFDETKVRECVLQRLEEASSATAT
ncbi:MAG: hypothetical protein ACRERD_07630 [Candidatus Binatia bacterium]